MPIFSFEHFPLSKRCHFKTFCQIGLLILVGGMFFYLTVKEEVIKSYTTKNPEICIVFISFNRPSLLKYTSSLVFKHLKYTEPNLTYESILIDQASPKDSLFTDLFDIYVYSKEPKGFAWPFNLAYFGICKSEYIAVFEDDWSLKNVKIEIFRKSIDAIKNTSMALGVTIRDDPDAFCKDPKSLLCVANDEYGYGSYTNGPSVYSLERLRRLGLQNSNAELPEHEWSIKASLMGMGMLRMFPKGIVTHLGTRSTRGKI